MARDKNGEGQAEAPAATRPIRERYAAPLRVAMLGSLPPLRGISSHCVMLAPVVSRLVPVEFVTFKAMYPGFLYPGGKQNDDGAFSTAGEPGLTVRRSLAWYNPFGWIAEGIRIRADVMHAQHWSLPLAPIYLVVLLILKMRGVKIVLTLHNIRAHERSLLYSAATRALCQLADCCIVLSESNLGQAQIALNLPRRKLRKIVDGVKSSLNDGPADRAAARRALGLPADAPVALCFGAIRPYKGIDVLLRAFAEVHQEIPQAMLVIAGQTWNDWKPYEEMINQLGLRANVREHLKYIPSAEVKPWFDAADLCVLPYKHFDSQSGVGMAALAFCKPMIVTDVGGLPELVADRRCVVPPNDPGALAAALIESLKDPERLARMRDDAARLAETFSWDRIAAETVGLYESLCV